MQNSLTLLAGVCAIVGVVAGMVIWFRRNARQHAEILTTGLRVIDVFLPLPANGDVLLTGGLKSGTTVLANELAYRFLTDPHRRCRVVYYLDEILPDVANRDAELTELLPMLAHKHQVSRVSEADIQRHLEESTGVSLVVFAASENERFVQTFRDAVQHARKDSNANPSLTSVVVSESAASREFDAILSASEAIAKAGIYPAIDLRESSSSLMTHPSITEKHRAVAAVTATAMQKVVEHLYAGAVQDPDWEFNRLIDQRPALQALCYISQPFFTAEIYTGKPAVRISVRHGVQQFAEIQAGKYRKIAPNRFLYQNQLPSDT